MTPHLPQADATESFTWMDSAGQVYTSSRDSPEGRALSGGLGLIGIITGARRGTAARAACGARGCTRPLQHLAAQRAATQPAEVTLRMTPPSLTKAVSRTFLDDANLAADIDVYLKVGPVGGAALSRRLR